MTPLTRRQALGLAATSAATALGATVEAASAQGPGKINQETPVHSNAVADSHGPRQLFAVVDQEGTLKRGLHALAVKRLDIGVYEVSFSRDIRRGAYLATIGGHSYGGLPPVGQIGVMGRANNPKAVLVTTVDSSGNPVNAGFHLLVVSPEGYA